jgi:glycosyltransferase involved in cell wall biosynthesis
MNVELKEVPAANERAGLAIVANVPTPYRVHLHRRLAAGIPELKLHSLFTHRNNEFQWQLSYPPEINAVEFALSGEPPSRWRPWFDWRKGASLIGYLKAHNVRAVVSLGYYCLTNVRVMRYCRRHGIPVFLSADSNVRNESNVRGLRRMLKRMVVGWVVRQCTGILPIGTCCQQFYESYGAHPSRCFWVPFEPDYEYLTSVPAAELEDFRRQHGLWAGRRYLLFSGRLIGLKRIDLLLEAFAGIADWRSDWHLVIAGDGPLMADLQARVPPALAPRVHWLGFLDVQQMRCAYHASEALVLPSNREAWGMVVNEALAAGLAIVISDRPGAAADLVPDDVNGRVFERDNLESLRQALLDVTDPQKHARYRDSAPKVLEAWRAKADPVRGMRRALTFAGVLPSV